ncbi:uncharacterized protein ACA1_256570 [Acanthamoeba castellanii str. Neff]|uniref:Uncharacterized protein n=1 Tax=Acanthamoeba castellanii (strain ATCC 30010 / Neff) TaxID=1257118 RepID=L8GFL7_ACACF|nr:uncharacterized protein ACA1_256570 [Acanthamoeba castellanii str. Neff]ELR11518.1 hypothetical protein ACA1_256570 [Acanthamoeba castellanii str. Neff]
MLLPTLRRSKPELETSPSQRGLGKWEDLARADSSSASHTRLPGHIAHPKPSGAVCSPRWIDDNATPGIQRYRTGAQLAAFAAVCDLRRDCQRWVRHFSQWSWFTLGSCAFL